MTKRVSCDETLDFANTPLDRGGSQKRQCLIDCQRDGTCDFELLSFESGSGIKSVTMNKMKIDEDRSKAEDDTGFSFGKLKTFVAEYDVEIADTVADTFRAASDPQFVIPESHLSLPSLCIQERKSNATSYDQIGKSL